MIQMDMFQANQIGMFTKIEQPTAVLTPAQKFTKMAYPNGGGNPSQIVFHEDAGHGWLQVPHSLIQQLGIGSKISGCSYRDKDFAYLEEDCDLSVFFRAIGINDRETAQLFWEIIGREYKDHSPIRSKRRYK